jgi:hypothetical protein
MSRRHSSVIRGLTPEAINENEEKHVQGRFGKLFKLDPAAFKPESLEKLASAMVNSFDSPKDGHDPEESGIPSLYTYFGQFIDHDLTFDPDGSFQKEKDDTAVVDFRTPALDMDNIYGRGPGDQPYLYDAEGRKFLLGDPLTLGAPGARDLQRNTEGRALIGDPRNDENTIVSQLQSLVLRFHNRAVDEHGPHTPFDVIQKFVRHHYQYVVLTDFLTRIVSAPVLDSLKTNGHYDRSKLKIFPLDGPTFMPVEFSVAAYRLGHSMVRPGYRLNDANLIAIFPVLRPPGQPNVLFPEGLTGFRKMVSNWGIDWGRFIDIDVRPYKGATGGIENFQRLQFAYRIDTSLVNPLGGLPLSVASNPPKSLALRNLERGVQFGLPTGQDVAKKLIALGVKDVKVLTDDEIKIGQGTIPPQKDIKKITDFGDDFAGRCPLWTYVLAEAMHYKTEMTLPVSGPEVKIKYPQLGPVGGRIVAEVLLGLSFADGGSYLNLKEPWTPAGNPDYKLKDFVSFALNLEAAAKAETPHHGCPV